MAALNRQVVGVNGRRELQLLHAAARLAPMGILVALGLFIQKLAIIHEPAHRRRGGRRDLDQVQALDLRQPQGLIERHDPKLLLGLIEDPHLARADLAVPAMQRFA